MEQNKSTISLTAPPDSDWGKVEQFVINRGFEPSIPWGSYIACIILSYEGDLETEGLTEEELPLGEWLSLLDANYRMEDFDYE